MTNSIDTPFDILIGRELSSVEFVRDYIQLRFDGPRLTIVTDPIVEKNHIEYDRTNPDFCNTLCSFIGHPVQDTSLNAERVILHFKDDRKITILLKSDLGEAMVFDQGSGNTWVW